MEVATMNFETVSAKNGVMSSSNAWYKTAALGLVLPWCLPGQMLQLQQAPAPVPGINRRADTMNQVVPISAASDLLKSVREGFGFNVTELAELFGVTRPTIYSWLKNDSQPKREVLEKMQVLNAAATHWNQIVADTDFSYLLDYKGPTAQSKSIRKTMIASSLDAEALKLLIDTRLQEYKLASAKSREILGEIPEAPKSSIPKSSQKMHDMWVKNTKALRAAQNRKS